MIGKFVSGKDGSFEIRGVSAEHVCRVAANAKGHAGRGFWIVNRSGLDVSDFNKHPLEFAGAIVPLLAATDATHVLEPELVIHGTVTDEDGNPVAGALLQAGSDYDDVKLATTDNDGRYELTGMPHSENTLVAVVAPGLMPRPEKASQRAFGLRRCRTMNTLRCPVSINTNTTEQLSRPRRTVGFAF